MIFFKPDAIERNLVDIIFKEYIFCNGFSVVSIKPVVVTKKMILQHYKDNLLDKSDEVVQRVVEFYEGKMILILVLERDNAIAIMRKMLGNSDPAYSTEDTIRGKYGNDSYEVAENERRSCRNIMHASDSKESFIYEYNVWFNS